MKASICIATYDKPTALRRTLDSIYAQSPPFELEVIVVDDGSPGRETMVVCENYPDLQYVRMPVKQYGNPAKARNLAYHRAKGEVIIAQSDDVIHRSPNCIQRLVEELRPGTFVIATVVNVDGNGNTCCDPSGSGYGDYLELYTGPSKPRPLFFLGSLYRDDLYAVGGNDEEFVAPSAEDRWFAMCLMQGRGLTPVFPPDIVGHHQYHRHCPIVSIAPSQTLIKHKVATAQRSGVWQASGGPWPTT